MVCISGKKSDSNARNQLILLDSIIVAALVQTFSKLISRSDN